MHDHWVSEEAPRAQVRPVAGEALDDVKCSFRCTVDEMALSLV